MYADITAALQLGEMDPDAQCTPQQLLACITTAKTLPAALGWTGAPAVCRITTKLVIAATKGWSHARHWLHHDGVRTAVHAVLDVTERLLRLSHKHQLAGAGTRSTRASTEAAAALPTIPPELWLFIMSFFQRSWWKPTNARV